MRPKGDSISLLTPDGLRQNYFDNVERDTGRVDVMTSLTRSMPNLYGEHVLKAGAGFGHSRFHGVDRGLPIHVLDSSGRLLRRIEFAGDRGGLGDTEGLDLLSASAVIATIHAIVAARRLRDEERMAVRRADVWIASIDALVVLALGTTLLVLAGLVSFPDEHAALANRGYPVVLLWAGLQILAVLLENVAASHHKKVVNITSKVGSIGDGPSGGSYAYRSSKTALNMAMVNAAHELKNRGITILLIHPGWVQTDMGGPTAPVAIEQSITGIRRIIDKATQAETGHFYDYTGKQLPW